MKAYRLKSDIMLSLYDDEEREQVDYRISPSETTTLECDGSTIWLIQKSVRTETYTSGNACELMVVNGWIEEIKEG